MHNTPFSRFEERRVPDIPAAPIALIDPHLDPGST